MKSKIKLKEIKKKPIENFVNPFIVLLFSKNFEKLDDILLPKSNIQIGFKANKLAEGRV